ncbi:TolQ protein [Roseomonas mucosa]|uniref:Tol-Pal system protein TolQ n=1 Tax=Roseomonas mucosa TaxID=207340 RepID=A0A379N3R3_9PROT|nr:MULTISPECIES: protein TolQ [Roseomonas]MDT8261934.1 protein TolQ [Roseomonas sp. DSM 102946]GAV33584.1 biopolymer transport protein ExbB [Roseomonas sp. TAS13]AWV23559.1 TolQ protein [Roseomonas mucosa]MDT8296074.1 protein TolQ [Roseomonas mucosa]MDT8353226.1 protein TolQ [Roseomonas mucosa]
MGEGVTATNLAPMAHDLSLWNLFLQADWVVKLVMLGLLFASIWVWAIVFEKVTSVRRANRAADAFEEKFWSGGSLEELYRSEGERPNHPMAAVFGSGMREWQASAQASVGSAISLMGVKERADRAMGVTVGREMERMERWMVFLASVGSVAPFIGLFGTVWGIMNSFAAIAGNNNTNLAVVAPGIAEALFATAIGLVAAIPAVLAYNKINTDLSRYAARLEAFASEFGTILSRQADETPAGR